MKFLSDILAKAGLTTDGVVTLNNTANASVDTDRFVVLDNGVVKYRTGVQLLSDIGAASFAAGLPVGGTAGQILAKIDGTNYNTQWIDNFTPQVKHLVKLGANMSVGTPVYVSDAHGNNMIVSKASNTLEATSSKTMGLLQTGGVTNDQVYVITEGLLSGLDTSTATAGDPVWLGPNGTLLFGMANKPVAPLHMVYLGVVTRVQSNNGEIFVKVQNGYELDELHDVSLPSYINNGVLYRDTATNLWKHATIASILGYTPADDSGVVHIAGTETVTGSKTFSAVTKISRLVVGGTTDDGTSLFQLNGPGKIYVNTGGTQNAIVFETSSNFGGGTDNFVIRSTTATTWTTPLSLKAVNMTTGQRVFMNFGRDNSTYNIAHIGFYYNGANSAGNHIGFGFWGVENLVKFLANGNVIIGDGADAGYKLDVKGNTSILGTLRLANATTSATIGHTSETTYFGNYTTGIGSQRRFYTFMDNGGTVGAASVWIGSHSTAAVVQTNTAVSAAEFGSYQAGVYYATIVLDQGAVTVNNLAGSGTRMVVANASGVLSTQAIPDAGVTSRVTESFTATAGQTTFTITGGYVAGSLDVFVNGARLTTAAYTATNGTTVVLQDAAVAGDIIDVVKFVNVGSIVVNTDQIAEGATNLYFTNTRARAAISLTTTGTSGAATYNSSTGVLNIPNYGSALSGYLPLAGGTLTGALSGTSGDFSGAFVASYFDTKTGTGYRVFSSSTLRGGLGTGNWAFGDGTQDIAILSNTSLKLGAGGFNTVTLLGNGNLGIGTTTPNRLLELSSGSGATLGVTSNTSGAGIMYGRIALYSTAFSNSYIEYGGEIRSYSGPGVDYSDLRFYTANGSTSTERVRITSGGNVLIGIGTGLGNGANTNPLQVYGGVTISSTSGVFTYATLQYSGVDFVITGNAHPANLGANSIVFRTGTTGGGSPQEWMRIVSTGNVGIGTSNPVNKFHQNGGKFILTSDESTYGQLQVNSPGGNEATILLGSTGSGQNAGGYTNVGVVGIGAYGVSRNILVLGTGYAGGTVFITNNNVGIGTLSPGSRLTVHASGDGNVITMARSNGAYAWSLGISSASSFYVANNGGNQYLTIHPDSGLVTAQYGVSLAPGYHASKVFVDGPTSTVTINLVAQFPQVALVSGNTWAVFGRCNLFSSGGGVQVREFVIGRNTSGIWSTANYGPNSSTVDTLQSVTGSGNSITVNMNSGSYLTLELTVMIR